MDSTKVTKLGAGIYLVCLIIIIIIYAAATEYNKTQVKTPQNASTYCTIKFHLNYFQYLVFSSLDNIIDYFYYSYMDLHSFTFIGFSFLLAYSAKIRLNFLKFIKLLRFQAVGFSYFLCAYSLIYSNLWNGLWYYVHNTPIEKPEFDIKYNIQADFAGMALVITFACLLGKVSFNCIFGIATFEVFFYFMNNSIIRYNFDASDMGESICTHMFGALFGFMITCIVPNKEHIKEIVQKGDPTPQDRRSSLFSLFGTAVLFVFFPTVNGIAAATPDQRIRAVFNTFLALTNSVLFTFPLSKMINGKYQPIDIQRATIAGGVVMGTCASMLHEPFIPLILGGVAGIVTTVGMNFFKPFLDKKGFHDTCGVLWMNFLPGLIGGIAGVIAMGENWNRLKLTHITDSYRENDKEFHIKSQLLAIFLTIGISVGGGIIVGIIVKVAQGALGAQLKKEEYFDDEYEWDLEEQVEESDILTEKM